MHNLQPSGNGGKGEKGGKEINGKKVPQSKSARANSLQFPVGRIYRFLKVM